MVKQTQSNQPKPTNAATGTGNNEADGGTASTAKAGDNVASIKTSPGASQTVKRSLMASVKSADQAALNEKVTLISTVKQRMAHAADLYKDATADQREAAKVASDAALPLYKAVAKGVVSPDEVSAVLGDVFGYKVKGKPQEGAPPITSGVPSDFSKDGVTASKTPFGDGEAIRKRVVRLVQADAYVNGGEATSFFANLEEKDVRDIIAQVEAGDISIWSAYDYLAKLKPRADRVDLAFDAKRIAAMFESLAADGGVPAANIFRRSPALIEAYAALIEAIGIVDEMAATLNETDPLNDEGEAAETETVEATNDALANMAETSNELEEQAA